MKRKDISGITFGNKEIKMLQMADDTTIFTSRGEDIGKILELLKTVFKISGLKTNIEKTIACTLGPKETPKKGESTYGLQWKSYLLTY